MFKNDPATTSIVTPPAEGRPTGDGCSADRLVGTDGNAFAVMGTAMRLMRHAGASPEYIKAYQREATSGDYGHLLATTVAYMEAR